MKSESVPHYISVGINRSKRSLDWSDSLNIIAYAAGSRIVFYDPHMCCIVDASPDCHGSSITTVNWARSNQLSTSNTDILLSLSSNGTALLWNYTFTERVKFLSGVSLTLLCTLGDLGTLSSGHASSYALNNISKKEAILAVAASDYHCIVGWEVDPITGVSRKCFRYALPKRNLALDVLVVPLSCFPQCQCYPLIIYGGDDGKAHLLGTSDGQDYKEIAVLAGHKDWLTSLDFTLNDSTILLSCGAKDGTIRLWKICFGYPQSGNKLTVNTVEVHVPEALTGNNNSDQAVTECSLYCSLESVLQGHRGLVSHVNWGWCITGSSCGFHQLCSCSRTEDRSVIIWQAVAHDTDSEESLWIEKARLGEIGGNREGFLNAKFGPNCQQLAATSFQGGLHIWNWEDGSWKPKAVVSGHFGPVVDLDWSIDGSYLLTVSKDQTTRVHTFLRLGSGERWQEVARPQVHGYNMSCVARLGKYRFASGAEEKVIRGFAAPKVFIRNLAHISGKDVDLELESCCLPDTASVPCLGLSNKADDETAKEIGELRLVCSGGGQLGAPTEDKLMLGTLWPEVSKLYGFGNEILALASSSDGSILASSCRATDQLDAKIILWDTSDWRKLEELPFHRLSVTQLAFSPCDQYLLSVSRDRSWAIFERRCESSFYQKYDSNRLNKSEQHGRIIWSCCWIPGSLKFITASRDKRVSVWKPEFDSETGKISGWLLEASVKESDEVTAVAAVPVPDKNKTLVAIGSNSGRLLLRVYDVGEFIHCEEVKLSHTSTIRRLKFRPVQSSGSVELASCGSDNAVFIYEVNFTLVD